MKRVLLISTLLVLAGAPAFGQSTLTCSSDDMRKHYCDADTSGGVTLSRQRSDAACREGYSWGYDNRGVWVDHGCRAEFTIGVPGQGVQTVTCSSDDGRRNYCSADTSGGVTLLRQRSGSACVEGSTWGYESNRIWVDRGCRADFQTGGRSSWSSSTSLQTVTCSSNDGRRNYCTADTSGGVRLLQQRSGSECVEGTTWGYESNRIWVDRGCRADFEIGGRRAGSYARRSGTWGAAQSVQTVTCSSDDGRRNYCSADTSGGVRLVQQRSGSACVEGSTWGYESNRIWVDRGCRADFETGGQRSATSGRQGQGKARGLARRAQTVTCASDGSRNYCPADTTGGVLLLRQRGNTACRQGYSWGFDENRIWVDHGCRADFAVGSATR
ncbi:MAG: DUF3011 domain-containing protein [Bryobacterales bacterium]|nr:DUF3011 domain-containing protein [Bryobacterales bacterium]